MNLYDREAERGLGVNLQCPHDFDLSCELCKLRQLCLPAALSLHEISALEDIVEQRAFLANDYLFRSGDKFSALHAVVDGAVKTYRVGSDGATSITGFYLPGELFGFSAISQQRHGISAVALVDSAVCVLPFHELEKTCRRVPDLQSRLLHLMSGRIVDCQEHMAHLKSTRTAQDRLAVFLLSLSSRAARRGDSPVAFHLDMTGQDIGNYLGISAEAVSRGFTRLVQSGAIAKDRRDITLLDLGQLRDAVCHPAASGD